MKIVALRPRCVAIPLNALLRSNTGVHPGYFVRTVLEVMTDEGVTGLGEVGGGDQRGPLGKLAPRVIGLDPFQINVIRQKTLRNTYISPTRVSMPPSRWRASISRERSWAGRCRICSAGACAIQCPSSAICSGATTGRAAVTTRVPRMSRITARSSLNLSAYAA